MWNLQAALLLLPLVQTPVADAPAFDVVVYGGTSAGIVAATRLARLGRTVIVVSPDEHLGGLSSSGLGFTDSGDKRVVGGLARRVHEVDVADERGGGADREVGEAVHTRPPGDPRCVVDLVDLQR